MSRVVTFPPSEGPQADGSRIAGWWQNAEDGKLLCCLCPRGCTLGPGQRGFCFVRENRGGKLVSTTYGRSTGFCVDPIEKKPLHQFYPGTAVLSFGTAGCNLGCKFCQNWTTTKSRDVEAACETASPEAIAEAARRTGCRSVAFTYNDPIVWTEYAIDTARACHAIGIQTVAVTSGYMNPAPRAAFYEHIDAANVDLKGFTEDFYRRLCGGRLDAVLDTLRYLARETKVWLEITNLVIPQENDAPAEIERMCRWIVDELGPDVPLHFSAFHPDFMMTARKATPADTLVMAYDTARRAGLRYVYTGNVIDRQRQATYCPGCGQPVIQRDGYLLGEYSVRDGRCTKCNGTIAGRFDNAPGTWGGRRQPVRIAAIVPQLPPAAGRAEAGRNTPQAAADERARSKAEMVAKEATQVATCPHPNPFPEGEETKAAAAASPPEPEAALPAAEKPAPSAPVATSAADNTPLPTPHSPPPTPQVAGPSPPAPDTPDRPALSEGQEQRVFQAAGRRVVAAVRAVRLSQSVAEVLDDAAETPVYGAFVSLKRGGQLRSCCGFLGQTVPLREALDHAALRAAKDDPRFPPISPTELDHLDMEVWLLWGLQPVKARGQDRIQAITIGKHGLQIARGNARGLLLPGVATEHRLDAKAFLQQVCLKAGLPPDAWLRDDTTLMTFEGYAIHGRLATTIAEPSAALPGAVPQPDAAVGQATRDPALVGLSPEELDALARFCRSNLESMLCGATPSYYLPGAYDGAIHGVVLSMEPAGLNGKADMTALSLRADMPLQSTLFNVAQSAAGVLRSRGIAYDSVRTMPLGLTVLADPAMHGTAAEPDLKGFDPRCRALLVNCPTATALIFDPARAAAEVLQEAVTAAAPEDPARAAVFTLAIASTEPRVHVVQRSRQRAGPEVRPAAVAGAFYPGSARDVHRMLDELFSEPADSPPERWAGALVPHAGWVYSGRLAAKVLRRVAVPDQVVILCPRHRPGGAEWAVAPHARWSFPNGELAADTELAHRLAAGVEGLELDALAHQQEHAIEVQLPLLARVAPNVRIVAITVGQGDLARLQQFGRQMAAVLQELPSRPLLLISSDMNHFANDVETRRLDRMALDAIEALDPVRLFQTVERNRISMCGMRPAVVAMEALRHLDALDRCEVVGYTTSAEASGDPTRVVGYAGVLFGGKESGGGS